MCVKKTSPPLEKPRALIGWRLLSLFYDLWPALALWMLLGAGFTWGFYLASHGARDAPDGQQDGDDGVCQAAPVGRGEV